MLRPRLLPIALSGLLLAPSLAAAADATPPAAPAATPWQFEFNARLRQETVDDDAFVRDANATTLRLRAGLRLHWGEGFSALLEGEGIAAAGDGYNSGANGRSTRPAITDPEGIELNQAFIAWKDPRGGATAGRQRLQYDNQRWIGNSGWRQNEQTFDALSGDWHFTPALVLHGAWLERVHRVNGDEALDPLARERRRGCSTSPGPTARSSWWAMPTCTTIAMSPPHPRRRSARAGAARGCTTAAALAGRSKPHASAITPAIRWRSRTLTGCWNRRSRRTA